MTADPNMPFKKRSILDVRREAREAKAQSPPPQENVSPGNVPKPPVAQSTPVEKVPKPKKPHDPNKPRKPKPPAPPFAGYIDITASCGHTIKFGYWLKDQFKEQRKAKHEGKICPNCREAKQKAIVEEAKRLRREKAKARVGWKDRANTHLERLPDKSRYLTDYDHSKKCWTGTLTVFHKGQLKQFTGEQGGVFKLLAFLDSMYREWLLSLEPPPEEVKNEEQK